MSRHLTHCVWCGKMIIDGVLSSGTCDVCDLGSEYDERGALSEAHRERRVERMRSPFRRVA